MIRVQREDFDLADEYSRLRLEAGNAGAIVTFTGLVREIYLGDQAPDEERVRSLCLEHYPGMTEKALSAIEEQARERWQILDCRVIHRVGELSPGDQIVFVGVASAHRGDAFEAAEFLMDYLKTRAPFWKKQRRAGGSTEWVESRDSDAEAAARWSGQGFSE